MKEIMNSLGIIQGKILQAFQDPAIPRRNVDLAISQFSKLLDFVIEQTDPTTINRLVYEEYKKRKAAKGAKN